MRYLLDTNICIYLIKKKPIKVLNELSRHHLGDIALSSVTFAELCYGVEKSEHKEKNREALERFILPFDIEPFDGRSALAYGEIRALLEKKGKVIGALDLMIAAQALASDCVLVTNNLREFKRVPNLIVENWC